ncbi:hypothetical protein BGZ94_008030 [Podila epigama]|nr:hypothetical protein BGZ94_008030 [Podila epigama]
MTTNVTEAPIVPGYVLAGKRSDFVPTPIVNEDKDSTKASHDNNASDSHLTLCPSSPKTIDNKNDGNNDSNNNNSQPSSSHTLCEIKGEGKDAHLIKVIEIPQPAGRYPPTRRVAVSFFHGKWYAFLNGSALSRGAMTDIEDMGIVWGAGITCTLHGWTFDALSGQSDSTRFVVDTFDVKEQDGFVFVSEKPRNSHVAGPRRDFGGRELN